MKKSPDWEGRWDWLWKWKGENEKSHRIGKADGSDCFRKRDFFLKKKTFVCHLFKCESISNTYSCRSLINCFDFHSVCVSGPSIASSITSTETFFSLFFEKKESDQLHVLPSKLASQSHAALFFYIFCRSPSRDTVGTPHLSEKAWKTLFWSAGKTNLW